MKVYNLDVASNTNQVIVAIIMDVRDMLLLLSGIFVVGYILYLALQSYKGDISNNILVRSIMAVMLVALAIKFVPEYATGIREAYQENSQQYSRKIDRVLKKITKLKIKSEAWYDFSAEMCKVCHSICSSLAWCVRKVVKKVLDYVFLCLIALSPLFTVFFLLPQTRTAAINYYMILFGYIILPIAFLLGDAIGLKLASMMMVLAMGAATYAGASSAVSAIASGGAGIPLIAGASATAIAAFTACYLMVVIVIYVGIPFAVMKLLRGTSGVGEGISSVTNTSSNAASMVMRSMGSSISNSQKGIGQLGKK